MRAGKTTHLLSLYTEDTGSKVFVTHLLHRAESRTHSGECYDAPVRVQSLYTFVVDRMDALDAVYVDEAQFFPGDDVEKAVKLVLAKNKTIHLAGLDTDYRGQAFPWLLATKWSSSTSLTATCQRCSTHRATMTAYEGPPLDGSFAPDSGQFVSCCYACWTLPQWQK